MAYEDDMTAEDEAPQEVGRKSDPVETLQVLMDIPNIADKLDEEELGEYAQKVCREYDIDKESRRESGWEERVGKAVELAMLVAEDKNYPFERAANIKYPLLTTAALQFNARAYPAVVQSNRVVKCTTWGDDQSGAKAKRAERVSEHMSYQLLVEQPEWEEDTDRLLVMLPIVGSVFRKVYFDPSLGRNCTRLISADRLVVNYRARSIEDTPRITEELYLYPYEIQERIRDGRFIEFDYGAASQEGDDREAQSPDGDEDAPHLFLEQHRLLDLDGDGYPEPYIVTVHKALQKVCRIVANYTPETVTIREDGSIGAIRKQQYYVKYQFLPSPDGGFYGWGFGWLLKDIGEAVNTTLNQMMDAGHLSTVQGGLVSAQLGIKEKQIRLKPGEWRVVNTNGPIAQAVMPINYPGPSPVHFNLLDFLLGAGKDVAAIKDVLTGEVKTNMQPTTVMALIEQGLQVFTSIYKRVHRALKDELKLLAKLNRQNIDSERYAAFFDVAEQQGPDGQPVPPPDPKNDYNEKDMDILPVSDPNMVSRMQQLAKAEFLMQWAKENPVANQIEVNQRVLQAAQIDDFEKLIQPPPPPDPLEQIMKELLLKNAVLDAAQKEVDIDKADAEINEKITQGLHNIAKAEGEEEGTQLNRYRAILDTYTAMRQVDQKERELGQGGLPGVEGQPADGMGVPAPLPDSGQGGIGPQGPALPVNAPAAIPMGGNPVPGAS